MGDGEDKSPACFSPKGHIEGLVCQLIRHMRFMVKINDTFRYRKDRIFKYSAMIGYSNNFTGTSERGLKIANVVELYYSMLFYIKLKFSI
jgi:hypothetical protein